MWHKFIGTHGKNNMTKLPERQNLTFFQSHEKPNTKIPTAVASTSEPN